MAKLNNLKQISFSDRMIVHVEERLEEMGVNFPEYIRYLVLNDTKMIRKNIPYITTEEEARIEASIQDIENGNITVHRNKKALKEYFTNLM